MAGKKLFGADLATPLDRAVQVRDHNVIDMVRKAIERRHVVLAYQPVVMAGQSKTIAFYEGLIRVLDETGRVIPARDFITQVEDTEIGRQLDCLALEIGLSALARVPDMRLSVNLSARSMGYRKWSHVLNRRLGASPELGERLILEITENSTTQVPELVSSFMDDLRARNISFALDDFGAGLTSFRNFRSCQFDILKIDGQFSRNIVNDPDNQVITRAIIAMAQQFDMFCVAEQVERREDADYLVQIGVTCLQGYYYGAPTITPPWEEPKRKAI